MSSKSLLIHAARKTGRSLYSDIHSDSDVAAKAEIQDSQEECLNTFDNYDKEDIILNLGEYKDYLKLVSHAAGMSVQEYIISIIQKDRAKKDDIYRELLTLGERIKSRE